MQIKTKQVIINNRDEDMKLLYFDEQLNSMLEYKILTKEDINFFVGSFLKFLNIESHLKKLDFQAFKIKTI